MNIRIILVLLAAILLAQRGISADVDTPATKVKRVSVEEFDKLRANTNNVLLDVRSQAEFEKGRIPGAINIDVNSSRFAESVAALDTNKTYLVNCAAGMRSAKACKKMEAIGFKELYDLAPGFDGWKKAGKPVEK
jgi:rhodanese-related sulfurtransferase